MHGSVWGVRETNNPPKENDMNAHNPVRTATGAGTLDLWHVTCRRGARHVVMAADAENAIRIAEEQADEVQSMGY